MVATKAVTYVQYVQKMKESMNRCMFSCPCYSYQPDHTYCLTDDSWRCEYLGLMEDGSVDKFDKPCDLEDWANCPFNLKTKEIKGGTQ